MHPLLLEILPLVRQGYCCSQLLVLLALKFYERENPDWVDASRGLGFGIGQANGPCGLLTGGASVLAWMAAQKSKDLKVDPLLNDYALWFEELVDPYGGVNCGTLTQGLTGQDKPSDLLACGELLAACWEKILQIASDYALNLD